MQQQAQVGTHPGVAVRRLSVRLQSDDRRIIARPFVRTPEHIARLFARIDTMDEQTVAQLMDAVEASYHHRHRGLAGTLIEHFQHASKVIGWKDGWSGERKLLAGAYLTMEYSIESAALFNPSICLHPDQTDLPQGAFRFVLSLRATGEGHVSSIVFRTGVITPDDNVVIDSLPYRLHRAAVAPDRTYHKPVFQKKLAELGIAGRVVDEILQSLEERFTLEQLREVTQRPRPVDENSQKTESNLRTIIWLAESNYHINLAPDARLDELVIFPMSAEDSHGMEDLRLTRFADDDGTVTYFGTYTAYNGVRTLPMLLSTADFRRIEFHSLNGACAHNKGMSLFPRRIKGKFVMCSRIDGESLFIMRSDSVHFWETATLLTGPKHPWELMLVGNCGPPVETPRGWVLLTHGVGPMRTYALGALVLDLEDPTKIIGHLKQPLITPSDTEREGYVPNVVYTCGCFLDGEDLFIPFALADTSTNFAVVKVGELIDQAIADMQ